MVAKISLRQKPTYFQNIDYSNFQINLFAKNYVTYSTGTWINASIAETVSR